LIKKEFLLKDVKNSIRTGILLARAVDPDYLNPDPDPDPAFGESGSGSNPDPDPDPDPGF